MIRWSFLLFFLLIIRHVVELPAPCRLLIDPLLAGWVLFNIFQLVKSMKERRLDEFIEKKMGSLFFRYIQEEKKVMASFFNLIGLVSVSRLEKLEAFYRSYDEDKKRLLLILSFVLPIEAILIHLALMMIEVNVLTHAIILFLEVYALIWILGLYNRMRVT